jgi:hypothetical protein
MTDTLKLGDVIQWNENVYLVDYLDDEYIRLKDEDGNKVEPEFDDLIEVVVIGRQTEEGYARQNGLLPKRRIKIYFGEPYNKTVKGVIKSLKYDEIEVDLGENTIFINFDYKGIPRNLPIEKIGVYAEKPVVEEVIGAPEYVEVVEYIEVPEERKRFPLSQQLNDLLEHMVSKTEYHQRTPQLMDTIKRHTERYAYLRTIGSVFDEYGNVREPVKESDVEPIETEMKSLQRNVPWIIPIIKHKSNIIGIDESTTDTNTIYFGRGEDDEDEDYEGEKYLNDYYGNYKKGTTGEDNVYSYYVKSVRKLLEAYQTGNCEYPVATQADINAILDNVGEMNSTRIKKNELGLKQFHSVRLLTEEKLLKFKTETTEIKKRDIVGHRISIHEPDKACIEGYIMLKTPYIHYSRAFLPMTSILDRSTLAQTPYSVLPALKKDEYTRIENFNMVPKIAEIIRMKREHLTPSLYSLLLELEGYLVYINDLQLPHYKLISEIVEKEIGEIISIQMKHRSQIGILNRMRHSGERISPVLYDLMKDAQQMRDTYGSAVFNEEMMSRIMNNDLGRLYGTLCATENAHLLLIDDIQVELQAMMDAVAVSDTTTCKEQKRDLPTLSKIYYSETGMREDQGKEIFFDTKLDDTEYELRDFYFEEYRTNKMGERRIVDEEHGQEFLTIEMRDVDFVPYLIEKLRGNRGFMKKHGENVEEMARHMVAGVKPVHNGDYALLITTEDAESVDLKTLQELKGGVDYRYFVRQDGRWVEDATFAGRPSAELQNAFCNMNEECILKGAVTAKDLGQCVGLEFAIAEQQRTELAKMLSEFDDKMKTEILRIRNSLEETAEIQRKYFEIYKFQYERDVMKNNDLQRLITGDITREKIEGAIVVSPYSALRDRVLDTADMETRMRNIQKFVEQFTRTASDTEDIYWFYCKETDVKLLPAFFKRLADAYQLNQYEAVLEEICSIQGQISDDGDKIVDRYSGYVIRIIEYSDKEGFDESGHAIVHRMTVNERNPEEAQFHFLFDEYERQLKEQDANKKQYVSMDERNVVQILALLASYVKVDLTDIERKRMIEVAIRIFGGLVGKLKEKYKEEEYAKKSATYKIYICSAVFLSIIQIAMPSKQIKESVAGCIASLRGYPVYDEEFNVEQERSGIHYIACVLKKLSATSGLLSSIKSEKVSTISKYISAILKSNVYSVFETEIVGKRKLIQEWLKDSTEKVDVVLDRHEFLVATRVEDIQRWTTFLPPLKPVEVKKVEMKGEMKHVILQQTLMVADKIQEVIKANKHIRPLLVTTRDIGYLQNICCDSSDKNLLNPLQYFASYDKTIKEDVKTLKKLDDRMKTLRVPVVSLTKDTRMKYPEIEAVLQEMTIYNIFLYYAKRLDKYPDELNERMVILREMEFSITDDIGRKVAIIKEQGVSFSVEDVAVLLKYVAYSETIEKREPARMTYKMLNVDLKDIMKNINVEYEEGAEEHPYLYDLVPKKFDVGYTKELEGWLKNGDKIDDLIGMIDLLKQNIEKKGVNVKRFGYIAYDEGYSYAISHEYIDEREYIEYTICRFLYNVLYVLYEYMSLNYSEGRGTDMPRIWKEYYKYADRHIAELGRMIEQMKTEFGASIEKEVLDVMVPKWMLLFTIANAVSYSFKKEGTNTTARLTMEYVILKFISVALEDERTREKITSFFGKKGMFERMYKRIMVKKDDIQKTIIDNTDFEKKEFIKKMKMLDRSSRQAEMLMKEMKIGNWKETGQYRDYDEGVYEREDEMRMARQGVRNDDLEAAAEGYLGMVANDDEGERNMNDEME